MRHRVDLEVDTSGWHMYAAAVNCVTARGKVTAIIIIVFLLVFSITITNYYKTIARVQLIYESQRLVRYDNVNPRSNMQEVLLKRRSHLQNWCSKRQSVDYTDYENAKILLHGYDWMYIPKYRLFYCSIPKVGSTTMKSTLLEAVGEKIDAKKQLHDQAAMVLSVGSQNPKSSALNVPLVAPRNPFIKEEDQAKHSLIIVRNPYERLVSAYMDKIVKRSDVMKRYCTNYSLAQTTHVNNKVANITFSIFIDCVLSNYDLPFYDDHIYPMSRACGLCLIQYDMIVTLENFATEMTYVLSQLDGDTNPLYEKLLSDKKILNPSTQVLNKSNDEMDYTAMYRHLSSEQRTKIKLMYRDDFEIFGYNPDVI